MKNWSENWIDDDFNIRRVDIIVCLIQPRQVQQQWGYPDVLTLLGSIEFPDSIELTQRHWHNPESTELWRASTHDKKRNPCLLLLSMSSPYLIVHGTTYCKYVFKKIISLLIRPHPNYNQPTHYSTPGQFFGWVGFGLVVSIVMSHPTLHKKDQLSIYQIRFPSLV